MNAEIARTQRLFLGLYQDQRAYLVAKPDALLTDLLHESQECRRDQKFSVRAAAEINCAACSSILDERGAPAARVSAPEVVPP